ncbi:MAG: RNA polymerase sigma factor [Acidobacteriota bacterium]
MKTSRLSARKTWHRREGAAALRGEESDQEAIRRVLAGETDAFTILVERHHGAIYNYVFRMVGCRERAADLTQDVFVKVYTALRSFDPSYRFTTWVYRIAYNRIIDHLRRKRMTLLPLSPTSGVADEGIVREVATHQRGPEERLLDQESASSLARALAALSSEYRDLIILRHFQHRSYDEIAAIKNRPLGTIKNRLFRAREALRRRVSG